MKLFNKFTNTLADYRQEKSKYSKSSTSCTNI